MKTWKNKPKLSTLDKLKIIFAKDDEMLSVFQESIDRGFMTKAGKPTEKSNKTASNLGSYCMYLAGGSLSKKFNKTRIKAKHQ